MFQDTFRNPNSRTFNQGIILNIFFSRSFGRYHIYCIKHSTGEIVTIVSNDSIMNHLHEDSSGADNE